MVEIEPDALAVTTRFRATHTIAGDIEETCRGLTSRVETLEVKVNKKRSIQQSMKVDEEAMIEKFGYMMHNNPDVVELGSKKRPSLKRIVSDGISTMVKDSNALWRAIHDGEVSTMRVMCFIKFSYRSRPMLMAFCCLKWRKIEKYSEHMRVIYNDSCGSNDEYCHPGVLLAALSRARRDEGTDSVSRNAAIAVDVGDVTLVRREGGASLLAITTLSLSHLSIVAALLSALVVIPVFEFKRRLSYSLF